jgi:hypothetical protein
MRDENSFYSYRVISTPTLQLVQPLSRDFTCRVIRNYYDVKDYFVRVSFTNEMLEKDFYSSDGMVELLLG